MLQGVDAVALQVSAVLLREDESFRVDGETWQNVVVANVLIGSMRRPQPVGPGSSAVRSPSGRRSFNRDRTGDEPKLRVCAERGVQISVSVRAIQHGIPGSRFGLARGDFNRIKDLGEAVSARAAGTPLALCLRRHGARHDKKHDKRRRDEQHGRSRPHRDR